MDSSKSQHFYSDSCPGSSGSALKSSPSARNNPSPRKRHHSFTPKDDDKSNITVQSMPARKRHQSLTPKDGTASRTITKWRKLHEINVLRGIIEYYLGNGAYPFDTTSDMQNFYKLWTKKHGIYVDEEKVNNTLVELPERFFINQQKKLSGENIEGLMDGYDVQIYRLLYLIWGKEIDNGDYNHVDSSSKVIE